MIVAYVEPSGEAPDLAAAEAVAAAEALGGIEGAPEVEGLVSVRLRDPELVPRLAARLGLARRCLVAVRSAEELHRAVALEGPGGRSAVFRRLGRSPGANDPGIRSAGRVYREAGGRIDLDAPERRFWLARRTDGTEGLLEEVAAVDRRAASARRMPMLPFQRPISLPPRLARAAANLARVRPGDRVVDPFLGTGALLAEAGLLGARTYGIDRDPEMVRGALRNLAHLGVEPSELLVGDSGSVEFRDPTQPFDAVLTDPPYGRSSGSGGEGPAEVLQRVVPRWGTRLRPGGLLVVIAPTGGPTLPPPWAVRFSAQVRVHRSLTREFRVYDRSA